MNPATEDLKDAFTHFRLSLRRYLRRRLPDPAQADDLLQDVFLKALTAQESGRRIDNLAGWLYAATRTVLVDHYRAQAAPTQALDEELPDDEDDEASLHQELSLCLRPFIERLPPLYRETLLATELEGKAMRALAEEQGVSVSAIKSRAARGRAMLKAKLLACCHIEMKGGLVSDYHRKPMSDCAGGCV
ncbi:sigma-70 family RNA polymerase sigma factor [Alkalilimnicola ehrlichii]|nr:sigma-70 family RNA polymerase sigma factor [Alkalilimnicola ehrlichii]